MYVLNLGQHGLGRLTVILVSTVLHQLSHFKLKTSCIPQNVSFEHECTLHMDKCVELKKISLKTYIFFSSVPREGPFKCFSLRPVMHWRRWSKTPCMLFLNHWWICKRDPSHKKFGNTCSTEQEPYLSVPPEDRRGDHGTLYSHLCPFVLSLRWQTTCVTHPCSCSC
jgi:hypothetical protein